MPNKEEIAKGAAKPRSQNGKKAGKKTPGDFRFININVTEAMKKNVGLWLSQEKEWWGYVEQLVGSGYRVGLSYDTYNDCFAASLTNKDGPLDYRNACITARGGTVLDALARLVGLHYAVANEDWSVFDSPNRDADLW